MPSTHHTNRTTLQINGGRGSNRILFLASLDQALRQCHVLVHEVVRPVDQVKDEESSGEEDAAQAVQSAGVGNVRLGAGGCGRLLLLRLRLVAGEKAETALGHASKAGSREMTTVYISIQ